MMRRDPILGLVFILLAAAPAPAQTRQLDPERDPVFIRAQALPNVTGMDPYSIAQRAVVRAFLREHPNYTIEAFSMPSVQAGGASMDSGPLMAIAAGVPPHCIYVNFRQSSTYISQGFLEPLEVHIARPQSPDPARRRVDARDRWVQDPGPEEIEAAIERIRERVPKPAWPVVYREDEGDPGATEKHVWSMPTSTLVMAMIYRKDLFFDAGLDPDRPPENWEELMEYARKLTIPEKKQVGMVAYGDSVNISWGVYAFLVSTDARAVKKDAQGQWTAAFGTEGFAEAVYFLWRLAHEPFVRLEDGTIMDLEEAKRAQVDLDGPGVQVIDSGALKLAQRGEWGLLFPRGLAGMKIGYLDEEVLSNINPQLYGIAPVPLSYRGTRGSEVNCRMLGVFSDSTKLQQLAVAQLIWFLTGDEAQRVRTETYVENGLGLFVSPLLLEKFGYERLLRRVPRGWQEAFTTAMDNGVPEPYGRNTQNIYRFMSVPITRGIEWLNQNPGVDRDTALQELHRLAADAAQRVNVDVLGNLPKREMRNRRILAVVVLLLLAAAFGFMIVTIWRYFTTVEAPFSEQRHWRKYIWGYVLIAPGLGLVLWWAYLPLAAGLSIAFTDFQLVRDSTFVGVDNFAMVLFDQRFWMSMVRTLYFVALIIGLAFWPPILLAILLQEVPTSALKYFYRTVFYLPHVLAGVVVYFLWFQLYDPSESGVLNQILLKLNLLDPVSATLLKWVLFGLWCGLIWTLLVLPLKVEEMTAPLKGALWLVGALFLGLTVLPVGAALLGGTGGDGTWGPGAAWAVVSNLWGRFEIEPLRWIRDPRIAMLCVIIPTVWASAGPGCILYLAALKTVPEELYEAADIDGASNWHKVFYIVLPRLKYLIMIQFIAAVVGAFKGGAEFVLIMTGGGPNDATNLVSLEIFVRTFLDLKYGIGTAMAWLLGGLLIGFTAYQLKLLSRAEFKAAG